MKLTLEQVIDALKAGKVLRWIPAEFLGLPEEHGRQLYLNETNISETEDQMIVAQALVDKILVCKERDGFGYVELPK